MRLALTIGFRHGATTPVVIAGPEVPLQTQRDAFKVQRAVRTNPGFAKITVYELDGTQSRSQRFTPVAVNPEPEKPEAPKTGAPKPSDKSKPAQPKKS